MVNGNRTSYTHCTVRNIHLFFTQFLRNDSFPSYFIYHLLVMYFVFFLLNSTSSFVPLFSAFVLLFLNIQQLIVAVSKIFTYTYSDMSTYLSMKFYLLVLFTGYIYVLVHRTHISAPRLRYIHCEKHYFKLTLYGRYLICFHSYSNISLKYSWNCMFHPTNRLPACSLSH